MDIQPIRPEEINDAKAATIPSEVIKVFNDLIAQKWDGSRALIMQPEAAGLAAAALGITTGELYKNKWMDVEFVFMKAGWLVKYDKPGYNEDYEASFEFRKRPARDERLDRL